MEAHVAGLEGAPEGVGSDAGVGAAAVGAALAASCYCPRCGFGLNHLPRVACYCPRCGQGLATVPHDDAAPGPPAGLGQPPDDLPHTSLPHTSVIARGYAQAMFKLGRRYETANGVRHNPGEAMRCYSKAARLGSGEAMCRLTPRGEPPADTPATESAQSLS